MEKIRIKEAVLVEGRYDAHLLRSFLDGVVLETSGFSLLRGGEKLALLRRYAEEQGLVILTDSDAAGFLIRNRLKGMLPAETVKHAYIPPRFGKEKRKRKPSAQGLLGVEAMPKEVVLEALRKAGATLDEEKTEPPKPIWTKSDLYNAGIWGRPDSALRRGKLKTLLDLPENLSTNGLVDALNRLFPAETVEDALRKVDKRGE